jgi:hypothetical protein
MYHSEYLVIIAKLNDSDRHKIATALELKQFSDKQRIFSQGDVAQGFYIITKVRFA